MTTRLETWTPVSPLIKRRNRTSISSRAQLVYGTYEPDLNSAGILVPAAQLTSYTGPYTISTPGTLIENKDCSGGYFSIRAANVVIRNCLIRGGTAPTSGSASLITATHAAVDNLLIEDCTLSPDNASPFVNGVTGHHYTLRRSIIENCTDGCNVFNTNAPGTDSGVVIEGSWIRALSFFWGVQGVVHPSDNLTHNDCIQLQGGHGTIIQGNRLDAYQSRTVGHAVPPYATIPPADVGSGGTLIDRGTGTEADGRYNQGSLIAVQYNTNVGSMERTEVLDNYINGANIAVNAAITVPTTIGKIWRNKFSRDQGAQGPGGNSTWTITIRQGQTCDAGEGTANKNTYRDNGAEVLVRRNVP